MGLRSAQIDSVAWQLLIFMELFIKFSHQDSLDGPDKFQCQFNAQAPTT